jgi:hypothetical protein
LPVDVAASETTPVVREAEEQGWFRFSPARIANPSPSQRVAPKSSAPHSPDIWVLCASGATLQEISSRLGKTVADIASALADGVRDGKAVDVARLLGAERLEAIRAASRGANGDVVAVRRKLGFPAALAEIRLALTSG